MTDTVTDTCTMLRFAGFGGQGIVKSGEIFGAAAVASGKVALQNQSYGSSARGGLCTSDVAVSDAEILEIEPDEFDVLVVLSQDSADAFLPQLKPGGVCVYEEALVRLPDDFEGRAHGIDATNIAAQQLGRRIVTNVVVLGFCAAVTGLVDRRQMEQTIREQVPVGTEELNLRALDEGWKRADQASP